jgi:hypothetical protein
MGSTMPSTGRCLCGAIRYSVAGVPNAVLDCHCSICRRESGAPSLVYVSYRRSDVAMSGTLKYYRSSEFAKRGFCGDCGSPISYEGDAEPKVIWLTAGTHDDAGSLPQRAHVYVEDKLPWVEIPMGLKQWARWPEDSR